jgi:putative restriction endonuclease
MIADQDDAPIRAAAFAHLRRLQELHENLNSAHLAAGFSFDGERVPFINPRRGIFKPQRMRFLLSEVD